MLDPHILKIKLAGIFQCLLHLMITSCMCAHVHMWQSQENTGVNSLFPPFGSQ